MTHGRTYDEQRFSPLKQIDAGNVKQLRLAWHLRSDAAHRGAGVDAAGHRRRHVRHERVEQGVRARCDNRSAALDLRPEGARPGRRQRLLRRRESRRRGVEGPGVPRHARRPPGRARCRHRQAGLGSDHRPAGAALHHHRRAAGREGQGAHRQRRRGNGHARLRLRLRRRHRPAESGASTPCPAIPSQAVRKPQRSRRRRKTWSGEWWKLGGGGTVWDSMAYDPSSICSTSASATAPRGIAVHSPSGDALVSVVDRGAASRTPASTSGTTRRRRATSGTTTPAHR